jgi:hypothetical protein
MREKGAQLAISGAGHSQRLGSKEFEIQAMTNTLVQERRAADAKRAEYEALIERLNNGDDPAAARERIQADPQVRAAQEQLARLAGQTEEKSAAKGTQEARRKLDDAQAAARAKIVAELVETRRKEYEAAEKRLEPLRERLDAAKADTGDLTAAINQYEFLKEEERFARQRARQVDEQIEQLRLEDALADGQHDEDRLRGLRDRVSAELRDVRAASAAAETARLRQTFGDRPVSLFLTPQSLAANEPSLRDVTCEGTTELGGRTLVRFRKGDASWAIDPSSIVAVIQTEAQVNPAPAK